MEAAAADDDAADAELVSALGSGQVRLDEDVSPVAGRRFSRR
jgi:hypothetical protein